ncbi:phage antirepressor KilAC domain-containing protein [uncultured Allobaculum sp.]|uniref:phage antirepressor KilAC domain-containing protein n=1 Tax=uncultured Allobaculum sp. TaxID=1187017 RepID=UPI00258AF5FE|nr:phage antirepressor KilAC domain-containing protein [uncultured Allobaculum sp.]
MNELTIFDSPEFGSIRTVQIQGEPWLVGKDICRLFGDKNHNRSLGRVDEIDKRIEEITDSMGRKQKTIFVNESGLYSLLFAMQPQKANHDGVSDAYPIETQERIDKLHRFKRWVTSEVLPKIRQTGMYAVDQLLDDPDLAIKAFTALKEEREKRQNLELANKIQQQQIAELTPKATYYDLCLNCKDLLSVSKIAKDFGKSGRWLNEFLHEKGIQFKQGSVWLLYQKYAAEGYTQTKTDPYTGSDGMIHSKVRTCWTQKGRLFIYDLLKSNGILPTIEREDVGS